MKSEIRPVIYSDLPRLTSIKLLARGESDEPNSARFCGELQYLTAFLDERQCVYVLLIDRVPAAFCAIREYSIKPFIGYAYVKDLYVLPEWQGRGFGRKLLTYAVQNLKTKGYTNAVLEVAESNTRGLRFYEKFGFKRECASLSGYFTYTINL